MCPILDFNQAYAETPGTRDQGEPAYLVCRRDVEQGKAPYAEPIFLVDLALAHRFVGVRYIELGDPPDDFQPPGMQSSIPLFVVDAREAVLFDGTRAAAIVKDGRRSVPVAGIAGASGRPV